MWLVLLIVNFTALFVSAYGDNGEELKFQCPRTYELEEGCIYKGNFINETECLRRCQYFYLDSEVESIIQAICENGDECACTLPAIGNGIAITARLTKMEEFIMVGNSNEGHQDGSPEVRCGYLDRFITEHECLEKCTILQRSRGNIENPSVYCRERSRCQCENVYGIQSSFENLDTLEARHYNEEMQNVAHQVRLWTEMHNLIDSSINPFR